MFNPYPINERYRLLLSRAFDVAEENDGELPETLADDLHQAAEDRTELFFNLIHESKNAEAEAKAIRDAEKQLIARRKAAENRAVKMRELVASFMDAGDKVKNEFFTISCRINRGYQIDAESEIPEDYKAEVVTVKIDRTRLGRDIKNGKVVAGCSATENKTVMVR